MDYDHNSGENLRNLENVAVPGQLEPQPARLVANLVATFMSGARVFRGSRSNLIYSFLGRYFRNESQWRFMNYGYAFDRECDAPELSETDEAERYCAQLYHAVASQVDLQGKRLLDIGSGRGGGTRHVHRYLQPDLTVGIDRADSAVKFCQSLYENDVGLEFRCGDAMDLPFKDGSFDAVLNVESSHCYPDRQAFFAEVYRTLKPGGHFLYTDFNAPGDRANADLLAVGFDAPNVTDITQNVIRGLERDSNRRETGINENFPWGTRKMARLWAGTPDSWIFRDFETGAREYVMYRATKPV